MGGGGKGKGGGSQSNPAAEAQVRMAEQLLKQTDPLRSSLINRSASFLGAPAAPAASAPTGSLGGKSGLIDQVQSGSLNGNGMTPAGGGGFGNVMDTPTYLAFKESADRNFGRAKDNAIARLPGGGALSESLVDLESQRASNLTQGAGAIYGDELNRAMTLGTGVTGTSLNSLGQAGAIQAQMAAAAAERSAGKSGALGTGLGTMVGLKA